MNNQNHRKNTQHLNNRESGPGKDLTSHRKILTREPLEAMAAVCGDGGGKGNPAECPTGPVNS